jgi:multidrug efflux pump subunit AcrB
MSKFKCSNCEYISYKKDHIDKHILRKCKEANMIFIDIDIDCEFCKKNFSTKANLFRHLKTCKVKKQNLEKENEILKEKNKELEKENEILKAVANKPSINITNNNNNTIQLTPYNNPNLKDIEKFFDKCIKKQFMCIPKLVELVHFNSKLPENHNLLLTNFRSDIMKAYKGNKWQTVNFEEITNELIGNYERDLQDWADGSEEKMKYIEKWNKIKIRDTEEVVYKDLQQELRKVMYDNRSIVKLNKK